MTTPFACVLIAVLLPYVLSTLGGYLRVKQFGSLDNKHPRAQSAALEGVGARIYAAQANAWEALPVFASAVFVAQFSGVDPTAAATPAVVFVLARIAHPILYAANLDVLRSLIFLVGLGSCLWLFGLAAWA